MRSPKRSLSEFLSRGLLRLERRLRSSPKESRQILILAYMPALGYAVHMTPVYEALRRAGYTIVVATRGLNLDLLRNSPFVDFLLETPDPVRDLVGAACCLRRQLRAAGLNPQAVLTGPQDARTRIGLLGALACAGWRGGYSVHPGFYTAPLRYDRTLSRVDNNLRLAGLLGCKTEGCVPRVFFSPADAQTAQALLSARPALAIIPGNSGGLPTAWHDDRWAKVVRFAHLQLGLEIVYLGTDRDQPVIERIRSLTGGLGTSLAGRTSLGQLAAVLAQCDFVVSIMTGSLHVARAVGTPTLALGPAWEAPLEWMSPPQPHVRLLRGPDASRTPEYRLDDLTAAQVIAELTAIAEQFPPSPSARAERVAAFRMRSAAAACSSGSG